MKKNSSILIIMAIFLYSTSVFGFPFISTPKNYAVYQRNSTTTGGNTTVIFSGNAYISSTTKYKIEKLDKSGNFVSNFKPLQSLPAGSFSNTSTFYFPLSIPTGWYRFSIVEANGISNTASVKFGVGEVFFIAGQSNAQGFGGQQDILNLPNYDCVVALKATFNNSEPNNVVQPSFGLLNASNKTIGPNGDRPWFYQQLGNSIATSEGGSVVVPVAFFNFALAGSGIDNWTISLNKTKSMYNNNYVNPMVIGSNSTHSHPWGSNTEEWSPYAAFKQGLAYYGSMFGVRSILWHQGEAETKLLLTSKTGTFYRYAQSSVPGYFNINSYATKLNAIISDTRTILPNLTWAISKVSLIGEFVEGPTNIRHDNIKNQGTTLSNPMGTPNSYVIGGSVVTQQTTVYNSANKIIWASQNSDNYTAPNDRIDGTHFNQSGLIKIANEIYANFMVSGGIKSKSPILPQTLPKVVFGANSTSTSTSAPYYNWKPHYVTLYQYETEPNEGNPYAQNYMFGGYIKDYNGRMLEICPLGANNNTLTNPYNLRLSANSQNSPTIVVYPNPVEDNTSIFVNFESSNEEESVNIILLDESGVIIKEIDTIKGQKNIIVPLDIKIKPINGIIFVKFKSTSYNDTKRIKLNYK